MITSEQVANDAVDLLECQKRHAGSVQLLSIKVALPDECDANEVAAHIVANHPQYKAHSKESKNGPVLAVGFR